MTTLGKIRDNRHAFWNGKAPQSKDELAEALGVAVADRDSLLKMFEDEEVDHANTIVQRDEAEDALGKAYRAVTGSWPEWSNKFGYAEAVQVIEHRAANLVHADKIMVTLQKHYLMGVKCNHEHKTDRASCYCTVWRGSEMANVGAAIDEWILHVIEEMKRED